jgi:biopolymer transport protein ExbB
MELTFAQILKASGIFLYPLLACSVLGLAVTIERIISLCFAKVFPQKLFEAIIQGTWTDTDTGAHTVGGRILKFYHEGGTDPDGLKAYARLEVSRLERGLFLLDIVVAVAPLLGLLGTVTGLVRVFTGFDGAGATTDTGDFGQGISLALSTTILGLSIAIPALVAGTWLDRRVDVLAARIDAGVERLIETRPKE